MLPTKTKDDYITTLFNEYEFLSHKFSLKETQLNVSQWKFLRLRPANFPTVRIAQLAALMFQTKSIFSSVVLADDHSAYQNIFTIHPSAYWQTHYRFGLKAKGKVPSMGKSSIENILINTVAPLLVAYGKQKDEQQYVDRAVNLLQHLPLENNVITRKWNTLGLQIKSAFDSQALIELYNHFCQTRQCLNCNIGIAILKPNK